MSYGGYYNMWDAIDVQNDSQIISQDREETYRSSISRGSRLYGLGTDSYDDDDDDCDY